MQCLRNNVSIHYCYGNREHDQDGESVIKVYTPGPYLDSTGIRWQDKFLQKFAAITDLKKELILYVHIRTVLTINLSPLQTGPLIWEISSQVWSTFSQLLNLADSQGNCYSFLKFFIKQDNPGNGIHNVNLSKENCLKHETNMGWQWGLYCLGNWL